MTRQRPTGVVLVAIWLFLGGLYNALDGAVVAFYFTFLLSLLGMASNLLGGPGTESLQLLYTLLGVISVITGVGMFALGYGLLEGREWGRRWGVAVLGISALTKFAVVILPLALLGQLIAWFLVLLIVPALIDLLALFYLLGEEARAYCSEYVPAPGQWSPIQETQPAARPVAPIRETEPPPSSLPRTELVSPPVQAAAWLVSRLPGRAGRQFPLQAGRNTIGRDGSRCQVVLDDPTVSSEHAAVVFEHGRFVLYDLASTNGTFLNDQRIQRQMLYDGDEIRLGNRVLVFKKV